MTPCDWEKPGVREGMRRMLDLRAARIVSGERPIGWKLGFGAPDSLEKFALSGPLVGFLTDRGLHRPGAFVSVEGWTHPVAEPELAVHIGSDLVPGVDVESAISGIAAAIELADVHPPPADVSEVLGGNIYHRAAITDLDVVRSVTPRDLSARVVSGGAEIAELSDVEELTGEIPDIIGHCARLLAAAGETLKAGDIVIAGSVIPPVRLEPGTEFAFHVLGLPDVSVRV